MNEHRFSARSVISTALLGSDPPVLSVPALVRLGELFDVNEGAVRVALTRLAAAGETEARDGHHHLAGRLLERRAEIMAARALAPTRRWDRTWTILVIPGDEGRPRDQRAATRAELRRARMGPLRDGVWVRPTEPDVIERARLDEDVIIFERALCTEITRGLAASMWELPEWATRAQALIVELRSAGELPLGEQTRLRALFTAGSRALDQLSHDPLLPTGLLPANWPARELRTAWQTCDAEVRRELRRWLAGRPAATGRPRRR